jgi:hypothetical protein
MAAQKSVSQKIGEKTLALRQELWPEISDDILWHRKKKKGYTTIPRAMPFIQQIMNDLSSGKPLGQTYLALWCHTFDEYMVTIANPRLMAFESGFTGQRAEASWNGRMKLLKDFGFIDAKPGPSGAFHYVLILNPYSVIKELKGRGIPILPSIYHALLQRTQEIGATDLV